MSDQKQPCLLSFTLDNWTVLGGKVSVTLVDGVAVLVGRNGAGKSAILEGFEAITYFAIGFNRFRPLKNYTIPKILEVEILTPTNRQIRYKYELKLLPSSNDYAEKDGLDDNNLEEDQLSFNDCCQYIDEPQEVLWQTDNGITPLSNNDSQPITIVGKYSFLEQFKKAQLIEKSPFKLPQEMQWVYEVLRGVRFVERIPLPIHQPYRRLKVWLIVDDKKIDNAHVKIEISRLARKIFRMETEDLDELQMICQRMGLGHQISIKKFGHNKNNREYIAGVLLDGVDIGLLSDGTLQILSILVDLLSSVPSRTIMIEEPETQIHPAMLENLLNELESYTYGENLILSTHSPQVVSWTSPDKINLVYRHKGQTMVRKLQEGEIEQVVQYLREEGNLGEWIYSGILDDDE